MASVLAIAAISASTRFSAGATRSEDSQSKKIVMEEFMIPASDAGIEIYARNKYSTGMTTFTPERTLLFVHGSTSPAHTTFDLPLGGLSWMDYIASRGFDAYLLDVRGYGKSSRPKEMSDKPDANAPIVRTATAVKDVGSVVDFILKRRNIARLDLLGPAHGSPSARWFVWLRAQSAACTRFRQRALLENRVPTRRIPPLLRARRRWRSSRDEHRR
jgi:pimeloyl-ACP methyl ester carboxylesterase